MAISSQFVDVFLIRGDGKGAIRVQDFLCRPLTGTSASKIHGRYHIDGSDRAFSVEADKSATGRVIAVVFPGEGQRRRAGYRNTKFALVGDPHKMSLAQIETQLRGRKEVPKPRATRSVRVFQPGTFSV